MIISEMILVAYASGCCDKEIAETMELIYYSRWPVIPLVIIPGHLDVDISNIVPISNLKKPGKPMSIKDYFFKVAWICKSQNKKIVIVADGLDYPKCVAEAEKFGLETVSLSAILAKYVLTPREIRCSSKKLSRRLRGFVKNVRNKLKTLPSFLFNKIIKI
jgi:hypothetical protein